MTSAKSIDNLIGVTGVTGVVGGKVAQQLAQGHQKQRLLARDLSRVPDLDGADLRQITGYGDKESMAAALRGVNTFFLVSGHFSDDRVKEHMTAVKAAIEAGVQRVVYLSFLNAAPDATFLAAREHYQTEEFIRGCGLPYTFLRNSLYADLAPRYFDAEDATIRGPADDGLVSYVTRDDIVDCVTVVLTSAGHDNQTYDITGPEALTLTEVAKVLSDISGRQCTYYDETMEEAKQSRVSYGVSDEIVATWVSTYTAIANGELSLVSDDVKKLTGHLPQTFREFLQKYPESYQHLLTIE